MAKMELWEKRIRESMEGLARQLNGAPSVAIIEHETAREDDPEHIPPLNFNDPKWRLKLAPKAKKLATVSDCITKAIAAEEEGDEARFDEAMRPIAEFTDGMLVQLEWSKGPRGYQLTREPKSPEEERPFVASVLVVWWAEYLMRYREIVHLGVCRQCGNVYLKPKHGQKQRYCSRACSQKAYRERKKES